VRAGNELHMAYGCRPSITEDGVGEGSTFEMGPEKWMSSGDPLLVKLVRGVRVDFVDSVWRCSPGRRQRLVGRP